MNNTTDKSPAFQWYPKDILSSARVQEMSLSEEGAYRRLLDFCWIQGDIPNDAKRIARIIGKGATVEIAQVCMAMFIPHPQDPSRLIHDRLEVEREKQEHNRLERQKAANARWSKRDTSAAGSGKQVNTNSNANAMQTPSKTDAQNSNKFEPNENRNAPENPAAKNGSKTPEKATIEAQQQTNPPNGNANAMQMQCTSFSTSTANKELSGGRLVSTPRAHETDRPPPNHVNRQWLELTPEEDRMSEKKLTEYLQKQFPKKDVWGIVANLRTFCKENPGVTFVKERIKGWVYGTPEEVDDPEFLREIDEKIEKGKIEENDRRTTDSKTKSKLDAGRFRPPQLK